MEETTFDACPSSFSDIQRPSLLPFLKLSHPKMNRRCRHPFSYSQTHVQCPWTHVNLSRPYPDKETTLDAPFDMPLANVLERCPFSMVTAARVTAADWPVPSLAPPSSALGWSPPTDWPEIVDGPPIEQSVSPRLRPLPSLALDVLLFGDTDIAMASSTATTKTSSKRTGAAANGPATPASGSADAVAANDRDFFWTYTEEPHRTRRLAIIKAHPEACHRGLHSARRSTS